MNVYEQVAVHEAGHAAVARAFHWEKVTLTLERGRGLCQSQRDRLFCPFEPMYADLLYAVAGCVAEWIASGDRVWLDELVDKISNRADVDAVFDGYEPDWVQAAKALESYAGNIDLLHSAIRDAEAIVRCNWRVIEEDARELYDAYRSSPDGVGVIE